MATSREAGQLLEQRLTHQQAEFEAIARKSKVDGSVGVVTRPCTECREGWIVKLRNRLLCRACGYTYYL